MNNFKKGGFKKGGSSFGGRPKFGGNKKFGSTGRGFDRGDRKSGGGEMFSATCSSCKKACEVPFRPSGDKPVFCRDCFGSKDSGRESRDFRGGDRPSNDFRRDSRPQRHEEPVTRHEHMGTHGQAGIEEIKKQLSMMESKINRILGYISAQTKTEGTLTVVSEVAAPKKEKKSKEESEISAPKKKVSKKK